MFRFLCGVPHGAYFGIAALVAARQVPPSRRTAGVSRVMLSLTVATIVGVPLATLLGQWLGWRWVFGAVAAIALLTVLLLLVVLPADESDPDASPLRELGALRRGQVWLSTGWVGCGLALAGWRSGRWRWSSIASAAIVPCLVRARRRDACARAYV